MKKKAFTLAEVLITLAIIGVVAALTIPTVVTNYQAKALETQKKKSMSVLANGMKLLMANDDAGAFEDTNLASCEDKECYANEIKKVFNVITDNQSDNEIFNTEYHYSGRTEPVFTEAPYAFVTTDGMIFGLEYNSNEKTMTVTADINGIKNPNTGNKDLCRYQITNTGGIVDLSSQFANSEASQGPSIEPGDAAVPDCDWGCWNDCNGCKPDVECECQHVCGCRDND